MRIHLVLSKNREVVPFNYQQYLVGAFHKWLGKNQLHDELSLYSISWLTGGRTERGGLNFPNGSQFFISAWSKDVCAQIAHGIVVDPMIRWGMKVTGIELQDTPLFGDRKRFMTLSPVLIKRTDEDHDHPQYYFPGDRYVDDYLTETLHLKLKKVGMAACAEVRFDLSTVAPRQKMITFNGIDIKGSVCPVIVSGDPRAVQFAWEVGVGNSTGIGFGSLQEMDNDAAHRRR